MKPSKALVKVQVTSALFDFVVAGIFAFPILAAIHLSVNLQFVHELFGSVGSFPVFEPMHLLFLNMFGGFAIMWSTLRIVWREQPLLCLCDGLLRYYFAFLMFLYVSFWGVTMMLSVFIITELLWGTALVWQYVAHRKNERMMAPA